MRKLLLSLLVGGAMVGAVCQAQAVTLHFDVSNTTNWATFGVINSSPTGAYTTVFNAASPFDVTPTSNIGFGVAFQFPQTPANPTETFNYNSGNPPTATSSLLTFSVNDKANAGDVHTFTVAGTIQGTMNQTTSNTSYFANEIFDTTAGTNSSASFVLFGNTYLGINTTINGNPVFIGVLKSALLSPPSNLAGNSIQGIVTAATVPEPGTLSFLLGVGVVGSTVIVRRRRTAS